MLPRSAGSSVICAIWSSSCARRSASTPATRAVSSTHPTLDLAQNGWVDPAHRLDRRSLLLTGAGLLLAGAACSPDQEVPPAGRRTRGGGPPDKSLTSQPATS